VRAHSISQAAAPHGSAISGCVIANDARVAAGRLVQKPLWFSPLERLSLLWTLASFGSQALDVHPKSERGGSMLIEVVGWTGSLAVLAAYALLSTGRMRARSFGYQALNIADALGMAINGWAHSALPSVFNNVIWRGSALLPWSSWSRRDRDRLRQSEMQARAHRTVVALLRIFHHSSR
jgi:hypothetical protein